MTFCIIGLPQWAKPFDTKFLPIPSLAIAFEPSLEAHLRHWIAEKATEDVAARFYPWIEKTLQSLEYDLEAPASEEKARQVKEELRAADVTPSRMERAVREARQAAEDEQSVLEWIRSVQGRAYSETLAEKAFLVAKARLKGELGPGSTDLQGPPSPEQVFAFLLAWEELGGTSGLAALRELQRRKDEGLPSN